MDCSSLVPETALRSGQNVLSLTKIARPYNVEHHLKLIKRTTISAGSLLPHPIRGSVLLNMVVVYCTFTVIQSNAISSHAELIKALDFKS